MDRFARPLGILMLSVFQLALSGCGSADPAPAESDQAMIDELLNAPNGQKTGLAEPAEPWNSDHSQATRTVSRTGTDHPGSRTPARGDQLELRLREGDRFPLVKTIEQSLRQISDVVPAFAATKLELTLIITVLQVKNDAMLLDVNYSRVSYAHDVAGQQLHFDSANHQGAVPWDAIPYAGMVGNGFSMWLGRDNTIREMIGYRDFLERAVAQVPLERRETLLSEISNRFGDDGIANFVDDSIGILPYDSTVDPESATRVLPGDVWTRERRLMQPVPIHLTSTYRLSQMNDATAEIDINGRVAAGDAAAPDNAGRLRITGGHSYGRCIIDRVSGLPLDLNLTRNITMNVTTADQQQVVQQKQILTTIRCFPEMRRPVVASPQPLPVQNPSSVQQVSGIRSSEPASNSSATSREDAPTGRAVRAVYPDEIRNR